MIEDMIVKVIEFAPAVAILLYLNWRTEKTLGAVLEWCLGEISDDTQDGERMDYPR